MVRKTNFLSISVLVSEIGTYMSKKKISLWISQKCFKTTQRPSLSVCGSLYGEKQFLLIFIRFNWFDQKKLFKPFQIFLRICPIWKMVRKINFLSFSELLFWDSHFFEEKKVLFEFPQKCFKTTERHSLAVCASLCGEKQILLIFIHFTGLIKNSCLNKSKFSSGFFPFNHGKKN